MLALPHHDFHNIHARISAGLRGMVGVSPAGTPTIIGAIAVIPAGIFGIAKQAWIMLLTPISRHIGRR